MNGFTNLLCVCFGEKVMTIEPTESVLFIFEVEGSADPIQHFLRYPQRQLQRAVGKDKTEVEGETGEQADVEVEANGLGRLEQMVEELKVAVGRIPEDTARVTQERWELERKIREQQHRAQLAERQQAGIAGRQGRA